VSNGCSVCHSSKPLPTTTFSPGPGDFVVLIEPQIIGIFMGSDNGTSIGLLDCSSPLYIADHVDQVYQTPGNYLNESSQRQQAAFLSNANIILTSIAVLRSICTGDSCMGNDQIRDTDVAAGNCSCFAQTKLHASNITFVMRFEVTLECGKRFTVASHTSRLDTAFYFKWPQTQDRAAAKGLDPLTRINRDISAGSFALPKRRVNLRRGVARVLKFVNSASEINKQPGWDITVWARRGSVQDMANENNENASASGQRAELPDAIVSGSLKCHISFMRPSCTTSAFLDALEEQKLTNSHYLQSSHRLKESGSRGERMGDAATPTRSRARATP
jgi:hypothetical protein